MNGFFLRALFIVFTAFIFYTAPGQSRFKSLVNKAYDSSDAGNYSAALELLYQAASLRNSDTGFNESINLYLGNNYEALNRIDSSIFYYGEALKYFEDKNDDASLAFLYNRLGSAEINFTKRHRKAIEYFTKQINYSLASGDSASVFDCYNNIGIAYKLLSQYDSALSYFGKVAGDPSIHNSSANRALLFIADTYSLLRQYASSLRYYDDAISRLLRENDSTYLFIAYLNKGDCLMKQALYQESMACFINAQRFLNSSVSGNDTKELYHNLAFVFNETGDYKKAFHFKNMESAIKDSINTANIQQAAAEAEAKYEVRRTQDSLLINTQRLALSVNEAKVNERNFIIVLVIAIAVSAIAFATFMNARNRKRINSKLEIQKRKVESLAAELDAANQTKTKLFSVISHDLRSPISSLYALFKLHEIKSNNTGSNGVSSRVTQLLDTMEDLLIWSKSQMEGFTLQPGKLDLRQLFDELLQLYQNVAESKQVMMLNQTAADVFVVSDENLLKTVLRNMISNAINHAIPLSTVQLQAYSADTAIIATVSNQSDEDNFAQLQNKLQQASPDSGNHGLGVFLMKEFIDKLHGTINLSYAGGNIRMELVIPQATASPETI